MTTRSVHSVLAPISIGEALDKLTILEIKEENIDDPTKLHAIRYETAQLENAIRHLDVFATVGVQDLYAALDAINRELWDVEDTLRILEAKEDFGTEFIELARSVYRLNDNRAGIKREINILTGSDVVEVKSYA